MATVPGIDRTRPDLEAASDVLKALASPIRLGVVRELSRGDKRVHELVAALGVSQPLISQHLRVLRAYGIVTTRRHAREVEYSLANQHIAHIVLDTIRHLEEPWALPRR